MRKKTGIPASSLPIFPAQPRRKDRSASNSIDELSNTSINPLFAAFPNSHISQQHKKEISMTKKTTILLASALALAATQCLTYAQTDQATNAAPARRGGRRGGGFGGFGGGRGGPPPAWIGTNYDDHQNMMDQLGIKKLRPGKS